MDNSSVQPNISLDHPRTLPLYTSASDASPKARKSPEVMAGFDQPTAPYGLDHLRVEQLWEWHPARLRQGPWGLPTLGVHPVAEVRQQRVHVLFW